jgi:TM2 domain-containing membrane protein YozV
MANATPQPVAEKKDPGIAALISLVCMLFLSAPSAGYMYLGNVRKGIVYLIAAWGVMAATVIAYIILTVVSMGIGSLCFPIFVIPLAFDLYVVWDVYCVAKGEKSKLPEF